MIEDATIVFRGHPMLYIPEAVGGVTSGFLHLDIVLAMFGAIDLVTSSIELSTVPSFSEINSLKVDLVYPLNAFTSLMIGCGNL